MVHCDVHRYVALDFSPAMHALAAEHLGELASRVTFVTRDLREPGWPADLGTFDAIVTLQAAHETRHKRHLVPLLERARTLAAPGGLLLYADHYLTAATTLPALVLARADQPHGRVTPSPTPNPSPSPNPSRVVSRGGAAPVPI